MKYVIEYHLVEGKFVGRELETAAERDRLIDSFAGSRKGVHDFKVLNESSGQEIRVVIPLDQVKVVRGYDIEDSSEDTDQDTAEE